MSLWSWLFLIVLAVVVPWLSRLSPRRAEAAHLSRAQLYASASLSLWVLAAIGYLVVRLDGQTLGDVYLGPLPRGVTAATLATWILVLAAAGLVIFSATHVARRGFGLGAEERSLQRMRPTNTVEGLWILLMVAPTAGVCEEFLYRGFLLSRVAALTGSMEAAALLAALLFGGAHLYQGWMGAARAAVIALLLAGPVLVSGCLVPAMAAHFLIDAIGILWLWPLLERVRPLTP